MWVNNNLQHVFFILCCTLTDCGVQREGEKDGGRGSDGGRERERASIDEISHVYRCAWGRGIYTAL